MNELELSNNLTTIETEIKSYQNIAGQSIFEIGRRLKHVKENNLAHGEWSNWLKSVNLNRTQATKFIKVSEEFSDDSTWNHIGLSAMYMIATLPEEDRNVEYKTSSGEVKKPIDMTNRELEDLKRKLKQRDEQNAQLQAQVKQAQRSEELAIKQLEDEQSKLVETKIEYKEIIPDDIKKQMKDNEKKLEAYEQEKKDKDAQIKRLREKIRNDKQKFETSGTPTDDEKIASLRLRAETNLLEICEDTNEFLDKVSHTAFREAAVAKSSDRTKNLLFDSVENLEAWCKQMRQILNSSEIIEEAIYSEQY